MESSTHLSLKSLNSDGLNYHGKGLLSVWVRVFSTDISTDSFYRK